MGVFLIPGREASRSHQARWSGGRSGAPTARHGLIVGAAVVSIAALTAAVITGTAPIAAAAAVAMTIPAAAIDVEQRRLPDVWIGGALVVLLAALVIGTAVGGQTDSGSWFGGLLGGALAMSLPVLVVHMSSPHAMGFGDVKTSMVLGAAVGTIDWRLGAVALCLAALCGGAAGVLGQRRTIPFGPFLVLGAGVTVLAHEPIIQAVFTGASTR